MAAPFRGALAFPANEGGTIRNGNADLPEKRNARKCAIVRLTVFDDCQDVGDGGQFVQAADGLGIQR